MRSASIRLIPPLFACMRVGYTTFAVIFVTILATNAFLLLSKGQPLPTRWLDRWPHTLGMLLWLGALIGLVIYAVGLIWGARVSSSTLRATTLWGRKVEIPWSSITKVQPYSISGLPTLMVESSATDTPLYVYTLGLNTRAVHDQLLELTGPDNPILSWLVPRAA